jgi:hypothetical protein
MSDSAEPKPNDAAEDLVAVANFSTVMEAELARNRLEGIGIPAFVSNELAVGVMPYLGGSGGGIGLAVTRTNAEEARAFLAAPGDTDPSGA